MMALELQTAGMIITLAFTSSKENYEECKFRDRKLDTSIIENKNGWIPNVVITINFTFSERPYAKGYPVA